MILKLALVQVYIIAGLSTFGQNCNENTVRNPELVEVREMKQKEVPEGYEVAGESAIAGLTGINSMEDISESDLRKIKRRAAKYRSCIVYVDIHNLWEYPNGLYYYWVKETD